MSEEAAPVETGAESTGIDSGVAELTADFFDAGEPQAADAGAEATSGEPGEQPAAERPETAPEPERQPRKAKAEPVAAPQAPAEQRFKIRGREYSAAEIAANPHLLEDLIQTYEQFPNLQKKHLQTLEQLRAPGAQPPPGQPQGPASVSPEQIVAHFGPEAAALGQQGYLEQEFTEYFPKVAANMVGYRKVIEQTAAKLDRIEGFLNQSGQQQAQATHQQQVSYVVQELENGINSVAESAPTFEPLKDPAVRAQFRDFVINQLNPEAKQVVGDQGRQFMERAAYAFFGPAIAQSTQQQAEAARSHKAAQRQNAQGDAGGPRPGGVQKDEWGEELLSFAGVPQRLATG